MDRGTIADRALLERRHDVLEVGRRGDRQPGAVVAAQIAVGPMLQAGRPMPIGRVDVAEQHGRQGPPGVHAAPGARDHVETIVLLLECLLPHRVPLHRRDRGDRHEVGGVLHGPRYVVHGADLRRGHMQPAAQEGEQALLIGDILRHHAHLKQPGITGQRPSEAIHDRATV